MATYKSKEELFHGQDDEGQQYKDDKKQKKGKPFNPWPDSDAPWPETRAALEELKRKYPLKNKE